MYFSVNQIQKILSKKGYLFFDKEKPYTLNIIGIRNSNTVSNTFNDSLYLIYRDDNLNPLSYRFEVTTDPGTYWLKNPLNVNGNAILVPGQYRGSHQIGLHKEKYEALVQKAPVKVWLYNNSHTITDSGGKACEGIFGINIHRSSAQTESQIVEKWSAGSTVFKKVADFNFFMDICRKASNINENSFTYTLLKEKDFS